MQYIAMYIAFMLHYLKNDKKNLHLTTLQSQLHHLQQQQCCFFLFFKSIFYVDETPVCTEGSLKMVVNRVQFDNNIYFLL